MQSTPPRDEDRVTCANHPYLGAAFTCERCGVFGCESCRSESLPTLCQPCFLRLPSRVQDISLEGISLGALLRDSFRLWIRSWMGIGLFFGVLALGKLVLMLCWSFLPSQDVEVIATRAYVGILIFAVSVFLAWTAEMLHPRTARSMSRALRAGLRGFLPLCVTYMLLFFGVILGLRHLGLLGGLVGLVFTVCSTLVPGAIVVGGCGLWASFRHSFLLSRRHFRQVVGMFGFALVLFLATLYFWVEELEPALYHEEIPSWFLVPLVRSGMDALVHSLLQASFMLTWLRLSAHDADLEEGDDEGVPSSM